MKKILLIILAIVALVFIIAISFRIRKDIRKKLNFVNTYAIQNVETKNTIRPFNANIENGVEIISYPHNNWECITWEFIEIEPNMYLLKNLYTQKTFQPASNPKSGVGLSQHNLGGTPLQYWEFVKQTDETYLIRLKGTELYITTSSNKTDSPIILLPKNGSKKQPWKLIRQTPWI